LLNNVRHLTPSSIQLRRERFFNLEILKFIWSTACITQQKRE
jgi:hypothetical protein